MPKPSNPGEDIDFVEAYSKKVSGRTNSNTRSKGSSAKSRRKFRKSGNVQEIKKGEDVWAELVQQLSR